MNSAKQIDCVGYVRLSDKDNRSNSIASQRQRVSDYCSRNNLDLLQIFEDDGRSGWNFDRPGFIELEKFCREHRSVQFLIIPHFDRFSRADPVDALVKERYFRDKLNVKVLQVSEPLDLDTNNGTYQIVRFMQAFASNEERNRIVDRTTTGIRYSLLNGRYCSMAPFGYLNSRDHDDKPILVIDEAKAPVIRYIFQQFLKGYGVEEVRRMARERGFYRSWKSSIQSVLSNPVYAGLVHVPAYKNQPASIVKAIHAPIISETDYWRAQEILSGKKYTRYKREDAPFRGVLRCACGKLLTAAPSKNKKGTMYWYYFCLDHRKHNHSAALMEKQFDAILDAMSYSEQDLAFLKENLTVSINRFINDKTRELMRVELAMQKVRQSITATEERYLTRAVSPGAFESVMKEKNIQLASLQTERASLSFDGQYYLDRMNEVLTKACNLKETWNNYDVAARQNFISQVFERGLVYTDRTFRTPYLNPIFTIDEVRLKELPLIIEKEKSPVGDLLNVSTGEQT